MDRKDLWPDSRASATSGERVERPEQSGGDGFSPGIAEALTERERRAQLIEDIAYKLTDLITIISGRVELLSERVPSVHVKDLQEIRQTAMKGVAFSELLLQSVQACRKEMGI
jgi:hypothetical protein